MQIARARQRKRDTHSTAETTFRAPTPKAGHTRLRVSAAHVRLATVTYPVCTPCKQARRDGSEKVGDDAPRAANEQKKAFAGMACVSLPGA